MMGHSASWLFALATIAGGGGTEVTSLAHQQLAADQHFEIQTADRLYRGRVVDRKSGECQLAVSNDGRGFSPPQTVYLLGATAGPQDRQTLVLMRVVKVGLKMELGHGDLQQKNREITSEVRAIRLGE